MHLKKLLATSGTLLVATLTLSACGHDRSSQASNKPAEKQVLNWSLQSEIATLDSTTVPEMTSAEMINNVMEGLFRIKNNHAEPGLATKTKVSKDGLTYTLTLRDSKWSNGDPVTAHDFVYAWRRTVDPKNSAPGSYLYSGIKNADAIIAGKMAPETLGVKANGDHELVVELEQQTPYFKLLMGDARFFPQNQKVVEKYGKQYGSSADKIVYNGPFLLKGWTGSNLSWKFVKNNNYWDKKHVKMQTINFKVDKSLTTSYSLYQANKVDFTKLTAEQAKQLKGTPGYKALRIARTTYMEYNLEKKEFKNKKIRQALAYAIDRKQFAQTVAGGGSLPLTNFVPRDLASYNGKDFADLAATKVGVTTNKKLAKKLLKEGLNELGEDHFEFTLLGRDGDVAKKETEFIQSQIEETLPEVKVVTRNIPGKVIIEQASKGNFDAQLTGWLADFADPINFLDVETRTNFTNMGHYDNAEYNDLVTAAKTTDALNTEKRFADMVKAAKLLNEDQPVVPLIQESDPELLRPNVHDMVQNTAGLINNFKEVYVTN
ncbi:peptide ABC transporter substrate-binding protein [Ligilactobacillus faecis]|uniref:Peptide ABC transporter substrate-binding protein n=1 Tax=Ligilactobacillus faecis TaxID=762833 RepID=A0ABV4DNN9_9LACO|nr:peptide ABC transporter substrate-binding protein [Ligilactobacillus faecis]WGN88910.1 peptide ABC transporter substrate-binding protein [Ligilactobacillus faecis]